MLYPLSLFYLSGIKLRKFLYNLGILKREKLPSCVVSVGNITLGGTGKTPFVIALANMLADKGFRVAVLSRGYKRKKKSALLVSDSHNVLASDPALCGDEPLLIAFKTKASVAVGKDRIEAFKKLAYLKPHVVLLDDGFQHFKIKRDLDICLVDGTRCFGNGLLFPAGPLREPVSAIKRANILVITKKKNFKCFLDMKGVLDKKPVFFIEPKIEGFFVNGKDVPPPKKAFIVTCVSNYEHFVSQISNLGVDIIGVKVFSDHHIFKNKDLKEVEGYPVIITEKDWINFPSHLKNQNVVVAKQGFSIPQELFSFIEGKLCL